MTPKRRGKAESAVARARLKVGRSAILSLKPRKRFRTKLSAAKKLLVEETISARGSTLTRVRKPKGRSLGLAAGYSSSSSAPELKPD